MWDEERSKYIDGLVASTGTNDGDKYVAIDVTGMNRLEMVKAINRMVEALGRDTLQIRATQSTI